MEEGWVREAGRSMGEQRVGMRMGQLASQRRTGGLERAEEGLEISRRAQPRAKHTGSL